MISRFRLLRLVRPLLCGLLLAGALGAAEPSADWSADMAAFAARDAEQGSPDGCVLFVGSSSIRLWTSLANDFPGVVVVNRGFGGSQIADAIVHFERLIRPHRPRLIVFYAGTNDIAAGKSPEQVAADFAEWCSRVHVERPDTKVVFVSLQYAPARWALREKMAAANALIARFCAEDPRRGFIDTNPSTLAANGEPNAELYSADRLHMSPAGYAVWTRLLTAPVMAR
jgi:lysophospholipase L1-like esterase